jgi:hypothetical protein
MSEAQSTDLTAKIDGLSDQQALSIVASLGGQLLDDDAPETDSEQASALEAAFRETGRQAQVKTDGASSADAGQAARELLKLMTQTPELRPKVEQRVSQPPTHEALAVPLILAAPAVFTGCVLLLQAAGHVHFERKSDGTWTFKYDPSRHSPLDDLMGKLTDTLGGLMGWIPKSKQKAV